MLNKNYILIVFHNAFFLTNISLLILFGFALIGYGLSFSQAIVSEAGELRDNSIGTLINVAWTLGVTASIQFILNNRRSLCQSKR